MYIIEMCGIDTKLQGADTLMTSQYDSNLPYVFEDLQTCLSYIEKAFRITPYIDKVVPKDNTTVYHIRLSKDNKDTRYLRIIPCVSYKKGCLNGYHRT